MSEIMDIINDSQSLKLLNKIYEFKKDKGFEGNTLELILSFCEEYELPLQEVGEILAENNDFKKSFESSMYSSNNFQREKTDNDEIVISDEW
jgi:hypothetical protein